MINLSKLKRETYTKTDDIYRLDHVSWMDEYDKDVKDNKVIEITKADIVSKSMKANDNSLFDQRFNSPIDVDDTIVEYSCKCGHLLGRFNENRICPECQTVVSIKYSIELLKRGWIDLEDNYIIMPSIYVKLSAYIGKRNLEEILAVNVIIDKEGNEVELSQHTSTTNPYIGIGIKGLMKRYTEILEFFKLISKKPEFYQILKDRVDITFTNKILVMSPSHRPAFISSKDKSFNYHNINAIFVMILTDIGLVKRGKRTGRKIEEIIWKIQNYMMQIYNLTIEKMVGKNGLIRGSIISGRLWYSSRMVIVGETSLTNLDEVKMSYKGFLSLFELEIINAMMRGYGNIDFAKMTAPQAKLYLEKCKYSGEVDEDIYSIIYQLVNNRKDDGIFILVNRNPSFALGSLQTFKVVEVFKDADKLILTIPLNSLSEFNADFDGDCLNTFSPKEKCVINAFREGLSPYKLILDRTGGYFNNNMTPTKDINTFIKSFAEKLTPVNTKPSKFKGTEEILSKVKDGSSIIKQIYNDIDILNTELNRIAMFENEVTNNYNENDIDLLDGSNSTLTYDPFSVLDKSKFELIEE